MTHFCFVSFLPSLYSSRQLLFRRSHQRRSSYGERIQTEEEDEIFQDKDLLVMTRYVGGEMVAIVRAW